MHRELPPPPPLPEGALPTTAPGYGGSGGGSGSAAGPSHSRRKAPMPVVVVPAKATRPEYGKLGPPTSLWVNYFKAMLTNAGDAYHYNVTIEPAVTNKKISREIFNKMRETFGQAEWGGKSGAYDGEKSFFTSGSLNFNSKEFPVFLDDRKGPSFLPGHRGGSRPGDSPPPGSSGEEAVTKRRRTASRGREFVVKIEFAATICMRAIEDMMRGAMGRGDLAQEKRALDALRVLDIVLRESASQRGYLLVRDNFFHRNLGPVENLGEGVEAWRGYHSSVRPTGFGLALNLDITMTPILKAVTVEDFLKERFNVRDLNNLQKRDFAKAKNILKDVRVETTHMQVSRTHKIAGFSDQPIRDLKFTKRIKDNEGNVWEEEVSVERYYYNVYTYVVKYPKLPALDVGNKKKPTFIPVELCKIVEGQRYTRPLSSRQRQFQIGACKQSPMERQRICENAMNVSEYCSSKLVAEFGLEFEDRLASVTGRVLPAPQLEFGNGRTEEPREGRWNFNGKMGGFNSPLSPRMTRVLGESTIIFGMDVSHGSPGDGNAPSIAAVVATKNWPDVSQYSTAARTQPARMEMIEGLFEPGGGMVRECLRVYYETCRNAMMRKPSQIIVYRDGLSESQFQECLEVEFTAFKRACEDLEPGYNPGITFIVAQKRHNTRFFPQGSDKMRNGNVLPGTVVDKGACHPHYYDFFLVSQAGLIGTSRPTHYHVLVHENKNLKPDDIQTLTNNLCYTFERCTTAIAMAAPAAYAHHLASRYRKLALDPGGGSLGGSDTSSLMSNRDGGGAPRPVQALPELKIKPEHSMFFC